MLWLVQSNQNTSIHQTQRGSWLGLVDGRVLEELDSHEGYICGFLAARAVRRPQSALLGHPGSVSNVDASDIRQHITAYGHLIIYLALPERLLLQCAGAVAEGRRRVTRRRCQVLNVARAEGLADRCMLDNE